MCCNSSRFGKRGVNVAESFGKCVDNVFRHYDILGESAGTAVFGA